MALNLAQMDKAIARDRRRFEKEVARAADKLERLKIRAQADYLWSIDLLQLAGLSEENIPRANEIVTRLRTALEVLESERGVRWRRIEP